MGPNGANSNSVCVCVHLARLQVSNGQWRREGEKGELQGEEAASLGKPKSRRHVRAKQTSVRQGSVPAEVLVQKASITLELRS